jgi:uncharacterized protein (AIM24 family)
MEFYRRIMTGLFGPKGLHHAKAGRRRVGFVHIGGTLVERVVAPGEEFHIDTGCVAAYAGRIDFDLVRAGSIKSMIFGGEAVFFAQLVGPGKVWLQSLPFLRITGRITNASPALWKQLG